MDMTYDVIIVGGGILGFSTALQLLQKDQSLKVAVLEKEKSFAQHQTGHNSGVIHAGVYYKPGSLKAQFCLRGCQATKDFCTEHGIPFQVPGKLIVATHEEEISRMDALAQRCIANHLTVEHLDAAEIKKRQPGLNTIGGFFVKETGIVDWKQVCQKYADLFKALGGSIYYEQEVTQIVETNTSIRVTTKAGQRYEAGYLITCSGLYSDRLVKMSGLTPTFKIIPFRGEYFRLSPQYDHYFNHLIYPVPDPTLPFLGVHFTPQMKGFVTVGPNALIALAREGYSWKHFNLRDAIETFTYWPLWKLLKRHFSSTLDELHGSLSKKHYLDLVHRYCPDIQIQDLMVYPAGVRAQAVDKDGKFIEDFLFMESPRTLHTCNAPSPAATSSLPIGEHIVTQFFTKVGGS